MPQSNVFILWEAQARAKGFRIMKTIATFIVSLSFSYPEFAADFDGFCRLTEESSAHEPARIIKDVAVHLQAGEKKSFEEGRAKFQVSLASFESQKCMMGYCGFKYILRSTSGLSGTASAIETDDAYLIEDNLKTKLYPMVGSSLMGLSQPIYLALICGSEKDVKAWRWNR